MKNIKANHPMQTRHGRPNYKAYSANQLNEMLGKSTTPKMKYKIQNEMNRKLQSVKTN